MKLQVRTAHGGHTMHWRTRKTQPTLRGLSSHVPWGCYMSWSSDPGTIAHRRNRGLVSFLLPLLITSVLTDQYITLLCVFYLNINSWHWAYGQEHCNSCLNHAHPTREISSLGGPDFCTYNTECTPGQHWRAVLSSKITNKENKKARNKALNRPRKGYLFTLGELKEEGRLGNTCWQTQIFHHSVHLPITINALYWFWGPKWDCILVWRPIHKYTSCK